MWGAFKGLITVAVLVGAGALIGLFWEEWQFARLASPATPDSLSAATRSDTTAQSTPDSLREDARFNLGNRVKVEVLNGAGEGGLARRFAGRLRALGFDVVATANADHFEHGVTHVLDRSGRRGAAGDVAGALSTDSIAVALDPDLYLDVTVVVGDDWPQVLGDR